MDSMVKEMKNKLFDVSKNPLVFRCEEDAIFFKNQKTTREFTMGTIDVEDNRKIQQSEDRKNRDMSNKKSNASSTKKHSLNYTKIEDDISLPQKNQDDIDWTPEISLRMSYKYRGKTLKLEINKRDWLTNIVAIGDKTISSSRTTLQHAAAAIASSSENAASLVLSQSTILRRRKKVRTAIASVVKKINER